MIKKTKPARVDGRLVTQFEYDAAVADAREVESLRARAKELEAEVKTWKRERDVERQSAEFHRGRSSAHSKSLDTLRSAAEAYFRATSASSMTTHGVQLEELCKTRRDLYDTLWHAEEKKDEP